jgi:ribonuclease D
MLSLAKEHSAVDWSTRPLKAEWLNYAALDVDVLLDLRQAAYEELLSASKLDWAEQEFSSLLSFKPKPQKQDKWRSMSGLHEIKDQRSLAIARELWQARENLAMKMDVSPSRLVPDTSIVSVSKLQIKTRPALAGEKSFIGRASRTYLDTWWHAVSIGLETLQLPELKPKSEGIPSHRNWETRYPEAHLRLKTLRPKLLAVAEEQNLPIENLLQPDLLRQYCWQPPEPATEQTTSEFLEHLGARRWQIELVTPVLVKSLDELTNLAE